MNNFSNIHNIHQNQPAIVVGGSKGIDRFPYKDFNGVVISMGDIPLRTQAIFKTDYWVFANSLWNRPWVSRDAEAINFINPKMVFVATAAFTSQPIHAVEEQINKSYKAIETELFYYDQRHVSGLSCTNYMGCCKAYDVLGIENTIQEATKRLYNSNELYSPGSTVAVQALAFAILMGCAPIYIIGVDIPILKKDYTYYNSEEGNILIEKYGAIGPYEDEFSKITPRTMLKKVLPKSLTQVSDSGISVIKNLYVKIGSVLNKESNQETDFTFYVDSIKSDFNYLGRILNSSYGSNKVFNLNHNSQLVGLDYIDTLNIEDISF